jgi:hypothetical protein
VLNRVAFAPRHWGLTARTPYWLRTSSTSISRNVSWNPWNGLDGTPNWVYATPQQSCLALTGAAGNCSEAKRRALALADTRSRKCRLGPRLLAIELPDLAELLVLEGLDIAISGTEKLLCLRTPETLAHNRLVAFSSFIGFFAGAYAAVKLGDLTLRNNDSSRARCCRSIYLQTGWPLTTAIVFPGGHPFGCG